METELINIIGAKIAHTVIPINKDGACLFGAMSYLMYGTQIFAQEIREEIVNHVVSNWEDYHIMTHDNFGNNYPNRNEYTCEMSSSSTYGSFCELVAAGQIYPFYFEVYTTVNCIQVLELREIR